MSSRLAQHYPKTPSSIILREDISEFSVQAGSHLSLQKLPLTGSPRCLSYLVGGSFSSIDTFVEYAVKTLGAKMKQLWETRNIPTSFFFPGTACPSLDTQEASGACWWRPQARSSLSLISMILIIHLEYQASRRSP